VIVLFVALTAFYGWVVPPLEGYDAIEHYQAALHIRATRRLPLLDTATRDASYELIAQPPLFHTLAALATAPWPLAPTADLAAAVSNPYFEKGLSHRQTLTLPGAVSAALAPLALARGVSFLGALLAVAATWSLARVLVPAHWTFALATAAVVAFNPVLLYLAVNLTTDTWAAGTAALTVALAARAAIRAWPPRRWLWAGAAGGLALLAKYSGLLVGLPALLALGLYGRRMGWRAVLAAVGWAALGVLLVAGYWYGRNLWLYGAPAPLARMAEVLPTMRRAEPLSWPVLLDYAPWLVWSYWGVFVAVIAPAALLGAVRVLMLVGLAGLPVALLRRDGAQFAAKGWTFALAALWAGAAAAAVLYWARTIHYGEQGRLGQIGAPAFALLIVLGWQAWAPLRWRPALHGALAAGMVGLALWGAQTLYTAYRLPPAVAAPLTPDRPLDVRFDGGPVLVGADLPKGAALTPGVPMPLTLYWSTGAPLEESLTLFIHVADDANRLLYQFDGVPDAGRHPTRQWIPGQVFADPYTIQVGAMEEPGLATLSLGFYPYDDAGQRVAARDAQGNDLGDRLVLGRVRLQPYPSVAPAPASPAAQWANGIALAAATVHRDAQGAPAAVDLTWWNAQPLHQDYTFFVQALDAGNQVVAQADRQPQAGAWPTSTWVHGDTITDTLDLIPAPGQDPATWQRLIAGWYDATGQRLPLADGAAGQDYAVIAEAAAE
jgi:4-amino-4-deoxy-L-arabinose transferase-like glycosyltransferase